MQFQGVVGGQKFYSAARDKKKE